MILELSSTMAVSARWYSAIFGLFLSHSVRPVRGHALVMISDPCGCYLYTFGDSCQNRISRPNSPSATFDISYWTSEAVTPNAISSFPTSFKATMSIIVNRSWQDQTMFPPSPITPPLPRCCHPSSGQRPFNKANHQLYRHERVIQFLLLVSAELDRIPCPSNDWVDLHHADMHRKSRRIELLHAGSRLVSNSNAFHIRYVRLE